MKKMNKKVCFLAAVFLCISIAVTFSDTAAKYFCKTEYPMKFALVENFSFESGQSHIFDVPRNGYYAFQLWGANGGESQNSWDGGKEIYDLGGIGGTINATAYFEEGETLTIVVGTSGKINEAGFNGGGYGGTDTNNFYNNYYGGGGGGATDVRIFGDTAEDRFLVAGGGGGGSAGSGGNPIDIGEIHTPSYGGNGGSDGNIGFDGEGKGSGHAGEMTHGGNGSKKGDFGIGGGGAYSGGGGGGGYYGGGGAYGSDGGGGGGSSYIDSRFTSGVREGLPTREYYSANEKDGYAIISFVGELSTAE